MINTKKENEYSAPIGNEKMRDCDGETAAALRREIDAYFASVGVEYHTVLSFSDLHPIREDIMAREDFCPQSVIMFLLPYYAGETENISRYAASLDYHMALDEINRGLSEAIHRVLPTCHMHGYGDHSPIDERHAALVGGLGVLGLNGLIINEKYGSYVFIGDLVTDIEPSIIGVAMPSEIKRCEGCGICLASCPTGILRGEGNDCLSAITQRKGELSDEEVDMMRKFNTVWGCDECQCHCPHNSAPVKTPIEFFYRDRIDRLCSSDLAAMDKQTLRNRAFGWRGRRVVERNLEKLGY